MPSTFFAQYENSKNPNIIRSINVYFDEEIDKTDQSNSTSVENIKKLVKNILDIEDDRIDEDTSISSMHLKLSDTQVSYSIGLLSGRISTKNLDDISLDDIHITKFVASKFPTIDSLPSSQTGSLLELLKRFLDWIVSIFYKLINKMSPKERLRLNTYQNITKSSELMSAFSLFGNSLKELYPELSTEATQIINSMETSKRLHLAVNVSNKNASKSLIQLLLKKSSLLAINELQSLAIDEEKIIDMFILLHSQSENTNKPPVIVSYSIGKRDAKTFTMKINIITHDGESTNNQESFTFEKAFAISSFNCESLEQINVEAIQSISKHFSSALLSVFALYNTDFNVASNQVASPSQPFYQLIDSSDLFEITQVQGNSVQELMDQLVFYKINSSSQSTAFSSVQTFQESLNGISKESNLSKIDSIRLFSVYVHSYASFVLHAINKNHFTQEEKLKHISQLHELLNEITQQASSYYNIESLDVLEDVFCGNNTIKQILDIIKEIRISQNAENMACLESRISPVSNQNVSLSQKLLDDSSDLFINTDDLAISIPLTDLISELKDLYIQNENSDKSTEIKANKKNILKNLSQVNEKAKEWLLSGNYNSITKYLPTVLESLPTPFITSSSSLGNMWLELSRQEIDNLSSNLSSLVKIYSESILRSGIEAINQETMCSLVNIRAIQHLLLNNAAQQTNDADSKDSILKSLHTKEHGIALYCGDMYRFLLSSPAHSSGHNPISHLKRDEIIKYFNNNMKNELELSSEIPNLGFSFSGKYCAPHYDNTNLSKEEKKLKQLLLSNFSADQPKNVLPSVLEDACNLELNFRMLLSPGETLQAVDLTKQAPYIDLKQAEYRKKVTENRANLTKAFNKVSSNIKFCIRNNPEHQDPVFSVTNSQNTLSIELRSLDRPDAQDDQNCYIPHGKMIDHSGSVDINYLLSTLACKGRGKIDERLGCIPFFAEQDIDSTFSTKNPNDFNQPSIQRILSTLKVEKPALSNDKKILESCGLSYTTAMNVLTSSIQYPYMYLFPDTRKILENAIYATGVLPAAILKDPRFFIDNLQALNSALFFKFADSEHPDHIEATLALLNLRQTIFSSAEQVLIYLREQKRLGTSLPLELFGEKIWSIDDRIKLLSQLCFNQHFITPIHDKSFGEWLHWAGEVACFHKDDELRYKIKGYFQNLCKLTMERSTPEDAFKYWGPRLCGLLLGSYLQNMNDEPLGAGYPAIDLEAARWTSLLSIKLSDYLEMNEQFRNECISTCEGVVLQDKERSKIIQSWDCRATKGLYENTDNFGFSLFQGIHLDTLTSSKSTSISVDTLISHPLFLKVFGEIDNVESRMTKQLVHGEPIIEYLDDNDKFKVIMKWNNLCEEPLNIALIIKSGQYAGEYTYSKVTNKDIATQKDITETVFPLNRGIWVNADPEKCSLTSIGDSLLDFSHSSLLKVFLKYEDPEALVKADFIIEKITSTDETLTLASSTNFANLSIISGSAGAAFIKSSGNNEQTPHKIVLHNLGISITQKDNSEEFVVSNGKDIIGEITKKSLEETSTHLFLGSENIVIPFEVNNESVQFLFSHKDFVNNSNKACFTGKIVHTASNSVEIESSACGFLALALIAAEHKDYNASLKLLLKAQQATFDISEESAFNIIQKSWMTNLEDHTSPKAIALCAKAFATAQKIKESGLSSDLSLQTSAEIRKTVASALEIISKYYTKINKVQNVSVIEIAKPQLYSTTAISPMFKLTKEELSYFKNIAGISLDFYSELIKQTIETADNNPSEDFDYFLQEVLEKLSMFYSNDFSHKSMALPKDQKKILTRAIRAIINSSTISTASVKNALLEASKDLKIDLQSTIFENSIRKVIEQKEKGCAEKQIFTPAVIEKSSLWNTLDTIDESRESLNLNSFCYNSDPQKLKAKQDELLTICKELEDLFATSEMVKFANKNSQEATKTNSAEKQRKLALAKQKNALLESKRIIDTAQITDLKHALDLEIQHLNDSVDSLMKKIETTPNINSNIVNPLIKMSKESWLYSKGDLLNAILDLYNQGLLNDEMNASVSSLLLTSILSQQLSKGIGILENIEGALLKDNENERNHAIESLSSLFLSTINTAYSWNRHVDKNNPEILSKNSQYYLLLEHHLGLVIRDEQKDVVNKLVDDKNRLLMCPPGFGKTSVTAPLFLKITATQNSLPIFISTSELTSIAIKDLTKSNAKLFNQQRYDFIIPGNKEISKEFLLREYNRLLDAKLNSGFVVTSIDNLANLDNLIMETKIEEQVALDNLKSSLLKQNDVSMNLLIPPSIDNIKEEDAENLEKLKIANEKLALLMKINAVIKNASFLVDEADTVLDINAWFNKAIDKPQHIPEDTVYITNSIFSFLLKNSNTNTASAKLINSVVDKTQCFLDTNIINQANQEMAEYFYDNLDLICEYLDPKDLNNFKIDCSKANFVDFVTGQKPVTIKGKTIIKNKNLQAAINILKKQLTVTLPSLLKEERDKDYGLDSKSGCVIVPKRHCQTLPNVQLADQCEIATSHFLYYAAAPCSFKSFVSYFRHIDTIDKKRLDPIVNNFLNELNTLPELTDLNRERLAFKLFSHKANWKMRYYMLINNIFSKNPMYNMQVSSNSQDMFTLDPSTKVQGFSGTMHEQSITDKLERDESVTNNIATEELEILLSSMNKGASKSLDTFSGNGLMEMLTFANDLKNIAIINCGGAVEQLDAYAVAEALRKSLDLNPNIHRPIVFVNPETRQKMIWMPKDAMPMYLSGHVLPKNSLVYFAPADTRGTDFILPSGQGLLIPGKTTTSDENEQACKRLRKLGNGHHLTVILPKSIADNINELQGLAPGSDVSIGQWLSKISSNSVEKNMLGVLKQTIRNAQQKRLQLLKQLSTKTCDLSSLFDKQQLDLLKIIIDSQTSVSLFDISKYGFVVPQQEDFHQLNTTEHAQTFDYLLQMLEQEELQLIQLVDKLTSLSKTGCVDLTKIEALLKSKLTPDLISFSADYKNRIDTVERFLEYNSSLQQNLSEDNYNVIFTRIQQSLGMFYTYSKEEKGDLLKLSNTEKETIVKDFLNKYILRKYVKSDAKFMQIFDKFYAQNHDTVVKEVCCAILLTMRDTSVTHRTKQLSEEFKSVINLSLDEAKESLLEFKKVKLVCLQKEAATQHYSSTLQDTILSSKATNINSQGALTKVVAQTTVKQNVHVHQQEKTFARRGVQKQRAVVKQPPKVFKRRNIICRPEFLEEVSLSGVELERLFNEDIGKFATTMDDAFLTLDKYRSSPSELSDPSTKANESFPKKMSFSKRMLECFPAEREPKQDPSIGYMLSMTDYENHEVKSMVISKGEALILMPLLKTFMEEKQHIAASNDPALMSEFLKRTSSLNDPAIKDLITKGFLQKNVVLDVTVLLPDVKDFDILHTTQDEPKQPPQDWSNPPESMIESTRKQKEFQELEDLKFLHSTLYVILLGRKQLEHDEYLIVDKFWTKRHHKPGEAPSYASTSLLHDAMIQFGNLREELRKLSIARESLR